VLERGAGIGMLLLIPSEKSGPASNGVPVPRRLAKRRDALLPGSRFPTGNEGSNPSPPTEQVGSVCKQLHCGFGGMRCRQ
jgi:hypothetical protein